MAFFLFLHNDVVQPNFLALKNNGIDSLLYIFFPPRFLITLNILFSIDILSLDTILVYVRSLIEVFFIL